MSKRAVLIATIIVFYLSLVFIQVGRAKLMAPAARMMSPALGFAALSTANADPGAALDFDGADDVVTIPHNAALNAYPLTVEFWMKTAVNDASSRGIVNKYFASSVNGWNVFLFNGRVTAWYFTPTGRIDDSPLLQTGVVSDGNWHHIVFVVDATGGRLYVDGTSVASKAWEIAAGSATTTTQPMSLGLYSGSGPYAGQLDEVRLWNRALSQSEIQARKNFELFADEAGLLAYYKFNQGVGGADNTAVTTLTDAGPNAFHGTLSNFALNGPTSNWVGTGSVATGITYPNPEIDVQRSTGNRLECVRPSSSRPANKTWICILQHCTFGKPEQVRFKYRLDGLDHDWTDVGTRRAANFPHLPPGTYNFHVTAASPDGVWNDQSASVLIIVRPRFYQTWWFRILVVAGIIGALLLVFKLRVNQVERARAQQEEFSRRPAQPH